MKRKKKNYNARVEKSIQSCLKINNQFKPTLHFNVIKTDNKPTHPLPKTNKALAIT